jgi:hypothetical protein
MSNGSNVIVGRVVGVFVGKGVFVMLGVPVGGVVVGACVLITNKSGVKVAGKPNGVAEGAGEFVGVGADRKENESGIAEHPARRAMMMVVRMSRFMEYLYTNEQMSK